MITASLSANYPMPQLRSSTCACGECASSVLAQIVALLALAVSRAANIWPMVGMVNYVRPPELRIPQSQQAR